MKIKIIMGECQSCIGNDKDIITTNREIRANGINEEGILFI